MVVGPVVALLVVDVWTNEKRPAADVCVASLSKWLTKFERMFRWKVMPMASGGG